MSRVDSLKDRIRKVAADLSGMPESDLDDRTPFLALGFDSLLLTQFAATAQKAFGVKTTFRQLMEEGSTIEALAGLLDKALPAEALKPAPPPVQAQTPLTLAKAGAQNGASFGAEVLGPGFRRDERDFERSTRADSPNASGMAAVFEAQLELMRQQLELLSGGTPDVRAESALALAPAAIEPAAPAAASVSASEAKAPQTEKQRFEMPKGFGPQVSGPALDLSPPQRAHLDRLIARYNAKTLGSKARTEADRAHHADPRTAAGFNRLWKEMVYPIVVERSLGAHLWDVDGNKYVDILNGFGPNFFGHRAPFIVNALKAQLDAGYEVGPQTPRAGEAARLFCELTGMDRVSWVNTGSEAVQAAIRLSRTVTGRDKIVVFSGDYHGNFDEALVRVVKTGAGRRTMPLAPGIPMSSVGNVLVLDYGEDSALETIAQQADEIAAVLVEPVQSRRPEFRPREFLHKLRAMTREKEIVLVFDEVITGFRSCPGGAQSYYGIEADLATYGKIIGGGMPIGVVAGRAKFMDTFDGGMWRYGDASMPTAGVTFFAGTFVRHPFAIAAAHASLSYLKSAGPQLQDGVNRKTTRLAETLNAFFAERGVKMFVAHFSSQMFIRISEESELATLFFYHLRDRGVHVLEGFPSYVTAAHTDADIDFVIAAAKDSIFEMQADGILPVREGVSPSAQKPRGFPLTDGQREIWVTAQLGDVANASLNESDVIDISGPLDEERFMAAAEGSLNAVEAFRLRFAADGSLQTPDPAVKLSVSRLDLSGLEDQRQIEELGNLREAWAREPFDLVAGPLVRARLARLGPSRRVFLVYAHHIVFDGYSAELLVKDIAARYDGEKGPLIEPYSAYVARSAGSTDRRAAQVYWREVLTPPPAPLDLPTDRPYPARRRFEGSTARGRVPAEIAAGVKAAGRSAGVGAFAMFLSAYASLMARLTSQEDFVIGVPAAGQANLGVETIGYCVNMLPMRLAPQLSEPFIDFAKRTQKSLIEAMEHQDLCLADLARDLKTPRDLSRPALIQNVFNYSAYFEDVAFGACRARASENRRAAVHHELFANLTESGDGLAADWDFSTAIFDDATIESWIAHLSALLADIAERPAAPIGQLSLMSKEARDAVVVSMRRG